VILPKLNERDLEEVPPQVKKGLTFHFAEHMEDVLARALLPEAIHGDVVAVSTETAATLPA